MVVRSKKAKKSLGKLVTSRKDLGESSRLAQWPFLYSEATGPGKRFVKMGAQQVRYKRSMSCGRFSIREFQDTANLCKYDPK
jgi:hypothetical protein